MSSVTTPSAAVLDEAWPEDPDVRAVLDAVVAELRRDPQAMVQAVLDGMHREVPSYAALDDDAARVVAQGVVHTVTTFIGLLADRRRLSPEEVAGIAAIGTVRAAQGVPTDDMLAAIRVALRWGWAHMLDRAAALPVSDATPAALGRLGAEAFEYMQQATAAMAKGAHEHARKGLMASAWAQRELLEEVLSGAFTDDEEVLRLAAALDLDLARPYAVLQLAGDDAGVLRHAREAVVAAVPGALDGSLRTEPLLHAVVLVPAEHREQAVAVALAHPLLVVASPPASAPSTLRTAYHHGSTLLDVARRMGRPVGLVHPDGLAVHRLLAGADPAAADELVEDVLGPVLSLRAGQRDRLMAVLEAALDSDGTLAGMGRRLGLHPKTVAARLRELERRTGLRVDRVDERLLLDVAVVLRRLHDRPC